MGVYSELDIDHRYGSDPFEESGVSGHEDTPAALAFAEEEPVGPIAAPPAPIQSTPAGETGTVPVETHSDTGKDAGDTVSEDEKKKAHEEAEAKRKAEFDAKQAAKKAAEQEQLDRLAAMSDEEVQSASMKRVSTDTEKLTRRNMKECVAEYIQTMCIEDPAFARKTMHPRKNMIHCIWYINRKAREFVEQEMKDNDIKPENGIYGSDVPDDLCYQWAVDYFNDPDAEEDHKGEEKFVPKPYIGTSSKAKDKAKKAEKKKDPKKAEKKDTAKGKPAADDGQFSLLEAAS